jgi:DNA-binding transcriptional ArsR family regulator
MSALSEILSSRTRAEVFRLLFGAVEEELHVREIQRRSGLNDSTIRQELRKLARLDLIERRIDSNRVYYKANKRNPLYPELHNLVLKTVGLADSLRASLRDARIQAAFVFGSIAEGKETAHSDVDLFVVGDLGLRTISGLLSGVSEKIGREINPHVVTVNQFQKKFEAGEHFISGVMASRKLFIVGSEHDLKAMVQ